MDGGASNCANGEGKLLPSIATLDDLRCSRKPGETGYKVPRGGLFELVAAPHYLFELVGWAGVAVASQHALCAGFFAAMALYLADRAVAQSEWNRRKLEDYPKVRKHLVPFVF